MRTQEPLVFDPAASKGKPENIRNRENPCPFCDIDGLTDILRRDGDKIWLVNKFRTLRDTMQTVLIESADHTGDPSNYGREEWRDILRFSAECFEEMRSSGEYRSVLMFKNMGPLSGGTLLHPHLQIVGLYSKDGYSEVSPGNFDGIEAYRGHGVDVTVSDRPVMGFVEFNVRMEGGYGAMGAFADAVQATVRYVLGEYHGKGCTSYNLFFFHTGGRFVCKVVPRWVASPYYIGYRISQVNCREDRAAVARELGARLESYVEGEDRR